MRLSVLFTGIARMFSPEHDDDDVALAVGIIVGLLVTGIVAVSTAPALAERRFGNNYERFTHQLWKHKWYYVCLLAVLSFPITAASGLPQMMTIGIPVAVLLSYVVVAAGVRMADISLSVPVDMSGKDLLPERVRKRLGIPADDEWELVVERVDDNKDGAPQRPVLSKTLSTLVIGPTRVGKTYALMMLAAQLNYSDTAVFAHGSIGDYASFFEDLGLDVIVLGKSNSTHQWNLFKDADTEEDLRQLAKAMFGDPGLDADYFESASAEVFAAVLRVLSRELDDPSHADVRRAVVRHTATEMHEKFAQHSDLGTAASHIDPSSDKQQQGVWSSVGDTVEDAFVGDFAADGDFSLQEYLDDPDDRVVIFETPELALGVGPMYRMLTDQSIQYSMEHRREAFLLLDEIDTLPKLQNLKGLAARGPSRGARPLLGVQTIGQLKGVYGDDFSGVVGNCKQVIGFGPGNDNGETAEFCQNLLGKRRESETTESYSRDTGYGRGRSRRQTSKQEVMRYPIEEHEMNHWEAGKCLISTPTEWWTAKLVEFSDVKERFRNT